MKASPLPSVKRPTSSSRAPVRRSTSGIEKAPRVRPSAPRWTSVTGPRRVAARRDIERQRIVAHGDAAPAPP
jgi:hypothetical protein